MLHLLLDLLILLLSDVLLNLLLHLLLYLLLDQLVLLKLLSFQSVRDCFRDENLLLLLLLRQKRLQLRYLVGECLAFLACRSGLGRPLC